MKENYNIEGMHCVACSSAIERVLNRKEGINKAEVSLVKNSLSISYDENQISSQDIVKIVKRAGFVASPVEKKDLGRVFSELDIRLKKQRNQLLLMALIASPLIIMTFAHLFGFHNFRLQNNKTYDMFTQFVLSLMVMILGKKFFINGVKALISKAPTMDTLIAVSTLAAFVYSSFSMFGYFDKQIYFDSAVMILVMVSTGKYLEARAKRKTSKAIEDLIKLRPTVALVVDGDKEIEKKIDEIDLGEIIHVRPGETIALDGVIVKGACMVDESFLTGEPLPQNKSVDEEVVGASINTDGNIYVKVTKVGEDTLLSKIIRLVEQAQGSKAPISRLADKVSSYFVPIVILIAILSALGWLLVGQSLSFAVVIFVSVLVIACPCALGLATPTAIVVATGRAANLGIIIKDATALEGLKDVKAILFDKTGTITTGEIEVSEVLSFSKYQNQEIIDICASIERSSEHSLAKAIILASKTEYEIDEFRAIIGGGVQGSAKIGARFERVLIGNERLIEEQNIKLGPRVKNIATEKSKTGVTVVYVAIGEEFTGLICLRDIEREGVRATMDWLRSNSIEPIMLTGDNKYTAENIASKVGISTVYSQMPPEKKAEVVEEFRKKYKKVAMVGDGVNDAVALARADIGVAVGRGTDIAIESCDVILINNDLYDIINTIKLSRATIINIKQNLFWALIYNIIGIPVAMGVLYIFGGPLLNPMFGCFAMSISSVFVVSNALRLRRFRKVEDA